MKLTYFLDKSFIYKEEFNNRNKELNLYYFSCRIVGDNIDYFIQARYQTTDTTNQSVHWTQQYAVLDRVNQPNLDDSHPQKRVEEVQLGELCLIGRFKSVLNQTVLF